MGRHAGSRRIACQGASGVTSRGNDKLLHTKLYGAAYSDGKTKRFEAAGGILTLIFHEEVIETQSLPKSRR